MISRAASALSVAIAGVLLLPTDAVACSCGNRPSPREAFGSAEFVGVAKTLDVRDQRTWWTHVKDWFRDRSSLDPDEYYKEYGYLVKFQVSQAWKGSHGTEIRVITGRGGGDCGLAFAVGESYLLYANKRSDGILSAGLCGRFMKASIAQNDIKELNGLVKRGL